MALDKKVRKKSNQRNGCRVLDREVEGSKLGLGLFFCSLEVSGKAIRLLLHLLRLRPGKTIRCPWPGHPSRLVKLFRLRLRLRWSISPSKADYFEKRMKKGFEHSTSCGVSPSTIAIYIKYVRMIKYRL